MLKKILNYKLLDLGHYQFKIETLFTLFLFWIGIYIVLKIIQKSIFRLKKLEEGRKFSIYSLVKYLVLTIAIGLSLQIIGFNLSVLMAGSAALLVGFGLGVQKLFSDYISGIIILIDATVKVGDIIEINGMVCTVQEIQLRTTTVLTRDDKYIILPNTDLTSNHLINWTLHNIESRFEISVGVDYDSDVNEVMNILVQTVKRNEGILLKPEPFARFIEFGESSLDFTVYFWTREVFRGENIKSSMRIDIFNEFKKHNINIPFPQRVVYSK